LTQYGVSHTPKAIHIINWTFRLAAQTQRGSESGNLDYRPEYI